MVTSYTIYEYLVFNIILLLLYKYYGKAVSVRQIFRVRQVVVVVAAVRGSSSSSSSKLFC